MVCAASGRRHSGARVPVGEGDPYRGEDGKVRGGAARPRRLPGGRSLGAWRPLREAAARLLRFLGLDVLLAVHLHALPAGVARGAARCPSRAAAQPAGRGSASFLAPAPGHRGVVCRGRQGLRVIPSPQPLAPRSGHGRRPACPPSTPWRSHDFAASADTRSLRLTDIDDGRLAFRRERSTGTIFRPRPRAGAAPQGPEHGMPGM